MSTVAAPEVTVAGGGDLSDGFIYVFDFGPFVKLGWTRPGPYERLATGFWHVKHPPVLCERLDQCELLHLWEGCLELEQALHELLLPDCGEFYRRGRLPEIVSFLANVLEPLALPRDPGLQARTPRMLVCCDPCRAFPEYRREDHARRSVATKNVKAPCRLCGRLVAVRSDKLKQHQKSTGCKRQ